MTGEGGITPDTKNWTWVVERPCPDCGLDTRALNREQIGTALRDNARQWPELLSRPGACDRPDPATWSTLEYGCHVRDVFRIFDRRLRLMLTEDDPLFPNWDQDATAVQERYAEQSPAVVAEEIVEAAARLAEGFDAVSGPQWDRRGRRSDGATFTVDTFARYLLHDPVHHLHDVTR